MGHEIKSELEGRPYVIQTVWIVRRKHNRISSIENRVGQRLTDPIEIQGNIPDFVLNR